MIRKVKQISVIDTVGETNNLLEHICAWLDTAVYNCQGERVIFSWRVCTSKVRGTLTDLGEGNKCGDL